MIRKNQDKVFFLYKNHQISSENNLFYFQNTKQNQLALQENRKKKGPFRATVPQKCT